MVFNPGRETRFIDTVSDTYTLWGYLGYDTSGAGLARNVEGSDIRRPVSQKKRKMKSKLIAKGQLI